MRLFGYYLLIAIVSFVPLFSFFSTSLLPHTHDGLVHLARIGAYFKALNDGQIPVRFAGDLNYGYGLPLFNFIYQTPYLISSILIYLGFGLVSSFKITLAISFILSGIFMFGFAFSFFKDIRKAIWITIFYQFFPFRLVEMIVRGSFGEVYAYAFLPLVLWGITNIFKKPNYWNLLLTSFATALLIISHNAISLVFFIISFVFILVFGNKKNFLMCFLSLFLGLLLASFYWIPAILEHKYTYGDLFMKNLYLEHFPPLQNFFIPNFFNSKNLQTGGISIQFGLFHVFSIVLALFVYLRSPKINLTMKKLMFFCFVILMVALFLMQPLSKPIWASFSMLRQFQFPWRLLSVVGFATSLLSVCLLYYNFFNKKIIYYSVLFLVIFSTAFYWQPSLGLDKINENYYWNFPLNTTYFGETDVIWTEGPAKTYPKQKIEVIDGKGDVKNLIKKSNLQTFNVDDKTNVKLVDHTQYFPGWRVYVDGVSVPVQFQYGIYRGQIIFQVPKGNHFVKLIFGESRIRFIADTLTVIAFLSLISLGVAKKFLL